jgi:hypothetical protein
MIAKRGLSDNCREQVPAQPVDATLFYSVDPIVFFKETRSFGLYSIKPKQGSVFFESALSNEFSH